MRRYCERRDLNQTYTYRPGAYVILPRDGFLLLTHQAEPIPEFQLPGGGIDPGEATLLALHREVMEETGWRVGRLRKLGAYRRFTYMPEYDLWAEKVAHVYVGLPVRKLSPPSEQGHTAVWMTAPTAIESLASEADRAMLVRYLDGEFG